MADTELLNRMYHEIIEWFVEHGRAPHYVELARRLDSASGRNASYPTELVGMGLPGCGNVRARITSNHSRRSLICRPSI